MAARDLAQNLPAIGSLTVTPDLLSGVAAALTAGRGLHQAGQVSGDQR
jgi:hypothetical protein